MKNAVSKSRIRPARRLVGWSFFLFFALMHLSAFVLSKPRFDADKVSGQSSWNSDSNSKALPISVEFPKGSLPAAQSDRILRSDSKNTSDLTGL